jgi:hypothetical protein
MLYTRVGPKNGKLNDTWLLPISKNLGLGATCLEGRFVSSKVGYLFQLGMVFPNLTPKLSISIVSLLFQVRLHLQGLFPLVRRTLVH